MSRISIVALPALALVAVTLAYLLVEPLPPSEIRIAAGPKDGGYYRLAHLIAEKVRPHGVAVRILETHGAAHNLELLGSTNAPHFVLSQSGTRRPQRLDGPQIRTLAVVDLEPVWLLAQRDLDVTSLKDIASLRIVTGAKGSGTRDLFQLLTETAALKSARPVQYLGHNEAGDVFQSKRADLMFMVMSADAPWIRTLFQTAPLRFVELREFEALTRQFSFLTTLKLPRGAIDLARNIPSRDTRLLATSTSILTTPAVPAATKMLVLQALKDVDHGTLLLGTNDKFPSLAHLEYPAAEEAKRFFSTGPNFIRRNLPYWLANVVERSYAFVLPLLAFIIPLVRILPNWLKQRKAKIVTAWYERLGRLERAVVASPTGAIQLEPLFNRLDRFESELERRRVHITPTQEYFNLRLHAERIRRQLWRKLIAGWMEHPVTSPKQGEVGEPASEAMTYSELGDSIDRDLSLIAKLEDQFDRTAVPGEMSGDLVDLKRALERVRGKLPERDVAGDQSDQGIGSASSAERLVKPSVTLVSDNSGMRTEFARRDPGDS